MTTPSPRARDARPASSAGLLLKIGASVAFTLVLLGLVELVAGFFVAPMRPQEIPGDSVSRTVTYIEVNPAPLERDVDLLWRNVPGAERTQLVNPQTFGRRDEWTIRNNWSGFRGPDLIGPAGGKRPFRILCVGDSITFGFSVDQPDTYPRQLSELLAKRHPGRPVEVINAGVPGWSWLQGLRFLDLRSTDLRPDLIIVGHGTNDQFFPSKFTDEERFLRLAAPAKRVAQKIAIFAAETNLFRAVSRFLPPRPIDALSPGCQHQINISGSCRRVSVEQISLAVHEIAELARSRGTDLLVVNTDFVQTQAVKGTRAAIDKDSLAYVDLVAEIMARRRRDEDGRAVRLGLPPATQAVPPTAASAEQPKPVLLRVLVPDPGQSYRVEGMGYFRPDFTFSQPLHDDGFAGDEKAGDSVFSTIVELPAGFSAIQYKFYQHDKAEFAAIPPLTSTLGDRALRAAANTTGPVDVFAQSLFLVERAHPDRDGHRVIAGLIADRLETFPAFRDYVQGGAGRTGSGE